MQIFLAALKEMTVHFVIWSFGLLLLWIASGKTRKIDQLWIARWEQKHNAPISTFARSWTKALRALAFLKWAVMITALLVLGWNWGLLQFFLMNRDPQMPPWVRDGGILLIKTMMFLLFVYAFLVVALRIMRAKLIRLREVSTRRETG